MLNALSVDLEEWFCVSNFERVIRREDWPNLESRVEPSTRLLLDVFARRNAKATFFILAWVAERHPSLIRSIAEQGHEIASHGYSHRLVYEMAPEEFREDIGKAQRIIREATGVTCAGYRAPSFSLRRDNPWAWKILADAGIRYDSSVFPVLHDRYGEPDAPRFPFAVPLDNRQMLEYPLSTIRVLGKNVPFAGGGYLRLYPRAFTSWGIRRLNRAGHPAIIYLHPWEVDPGQPSPAVSRLTLARHRVGMTSMLSKLDRLLSEFRFGPMTSLMGETSA